MSVLLESILEGQISRAESTPDHVMFGTKVMHCTPIGVTYDTAE